MAYENGASEALFEALHIEMMKRGLPAERAEILRVMAELGEMRSQASIEA